MHTVEMSGQGKEAGVLNMTLLNQYKQRKNNLLERLINAYLEEAPKSFQALRKAVEASDYDAVRMSAHALKSTSYNLGAARLSKMCQQIELAAVERDEASIAEVMRRIGPECFDVEQALCGELYQLRKAAEPQAPRSLDDDWN